ncbi:hypothetical protein RvY_00310 [Ramazzottius varieornatus]|uniref:Uncharacterized protein n=1 Tax=Ramazzottius varieornatus TaxID=947166 RepID=A0A1D1UGG5_RAMVA|nr:hypothetical protein RvY_00310 [Ramazzottius varieornatus]
MTSRRNSGSIARFIFKHALWKFTKSATTLLLFREKTPVARSSLCSPEQIQTMWMAYQRKEATSGRSVLINKVIYAKTEVSARVFLYTIVCRTGFETILYQCELALPVG